MGVLINKNIREIKGAGIKMENLLKRQGELERLVKENINTLLKAVNNNGSQK